MTTIINPNYDYWNTALALGDKINDDRDLIVHADSPQPGFYRTPRREAVAIWFDEDGMNFIVNGKHVHENLVENTWMSVCRRPITEEQFHAFGETGKWHDIDPAVEATIGHNIEGANDPDTIAALLKQLQDAAVGYHKITSEEDSKRAHGIRARINQLKLRCTNLHKVEKEPHLKAGQAVDRKWNPMIKEADAVASSLGRAMAAYEDDKRMAIRRAEREAEQARQRAEEARRAGEPVPEPVPEPVAPVAPLPEPASAIRSGYGRAASVRVKPTITGIVDMAALLRRYSQHEEVRALMLKLAQRDVDAGLTVEGVTVEDKAVVR